MTAKKRTARYTTTTRRRAETTPAEPGTSTAEDDGNIRAALLTTTLNAEPSARGLGPEPGSDAYQYSAADDESAMAGMDNDDDDPGSEVLPAKPTVLVGADAAKALLPGNVYMLFRRDAIAAVGPGYVRAPYNGTMVPAKTVLEVTLASGQVWYVCAWPGGCTRGERGAPYVSDNVKTVVAHQSAHSTKKQAHLDAAAKLAEERAAATKAPRRRYTTGVRQASLDFLTEHVDNPFTVRSIAGHTGHHDRSISAALTSMKRTDEEGRRHLRNFRKHGQSLWVWHSDVALRAEAPLPEYNNPEYSAEDREAVRRYEEAVHQAPKPNNVAHVKAERTFTYVGKTSQGVMLVRDESSGIIYRAADL